MNVLPDVRAILNCLSDPAILLGNDYRILMANDAYQKTYGDGRPLRQRFCYEVSHRYSVPCDLAGELCPLKNSRQSGQPTKVLHVHHTPRGREYVNVETLPVKNGDGEIAYFVEVMKPSAIAQTGPNYQGLVGLSRPFQDMVNHIDRVAPTNTAVLLLGETGTGKEVVAQTIHDRSAQSAGPFVPVECTGLAESIFESEMFGHMKGAFTGATASKAGLVESADGGTLFLDEIGDITLAEQVKLLRLLETRRFRRVGSTESRAANFRLICATNKNLTELIEKGSFREDLYYRLNVFEIMLPPLRDRADDLPLLISSVLQRLGSQLTFSDEALRCLRHYPFPGNVRELRNIVERSLLMCDGTTVLPEHLPAQCRFESETPGGVSEFKSLKEVEQDYIRSAIARHQGDRRGLAAVLGISERALYRKLAELRDS